MIVASAEALAIHSILGPICQPQFGPPRKGLRTPPFKIVPVILPLKLLQILTRGLDAEQPGDQGAGQRGVNQDREQHQKQKGGGQGTELRKRGGKARTLAANMVRASRENGAVLEVS